MSVSVTRKTFNGRPIRTVYDAEKKEWRFSAVDIVSALTEHPHDHARRHWSVTKARLNDAENELSVKCCQLRLRSADGKMYDTDVLNRDGAILLARRVTRPSHLRMSFTEWLEGFRDGEGWYMLRHKDTDVLEIELDRSGEILSFGKISDHRHLPVGTVQKNGLDLRTIRAWWKRRSIPERREGLWWLLDTFDMTTPLPMSEKSYGLSLSDQYWICPHNAGLRWEDMNFFHNAFSDDVGDMLFQKVGWDELDTGTVNFFSPDSTTDGMLRKRWMVIDGKHCLVKGGREPFEQEIANEVLASRICGRLGIPHAEYRMIKIDGKRYCVCDNFVTEDTELITAWHIHDLIKRDGNATEYGSFVSKAEELGIEDARIRMDMMIVLDFIIVNTDRHYNNFGLIRDANTLEWLSVAPVYDSGTSMWCNALTENMDAEDPGLKSRTFRSRHIEQIELVNDLSWLDIDKLNGIEDEYAGILNDPDTGPSEFGAHSGRLCAELRRRIELLRTLKEMRK